MLRSPIRIAVLVGSAVFLFLMLTAFPTVRHGYSAVTTGEGYPKWTHVFDDVEEHQWGSYIERRRPMDDNLFRYHAQVVCASGAHLPTVIAYLLFSAGCGLLTWAIYPRRNVKHPAAV